MHRREERQGWPMNSLQSRLADIRFFVHPHLTSPLTMFVNPALSYAYSLEYTLASRWCSIPSIQHRRAFSGSPACYGCCAVC